jgi:molybdopterin-guanine dinucleotide biosynthesis protein
MAVIVVAGQTKHVGKTTLICNIIAAFPALKWTAVKISSHQHATGKCVVLKERAGWRILLQNPTADHSDTARFLKSGADRALLLHTDNDSLKEACSWLAREISPATLVIVESASAAEFLRHDLLVLVLDAEQTDFKTSAQELLARADVFVLRGPGSGSKGIAAASETPVFRAFPDRLDPALLHMLATKLTSQY